MLPLNDLYNMDCMDGMRQFPDGYFDLAIVDPPYGINRFKNGETSRLRKYGQIDTVNNLKPEASYFSELFRVSKNQIIWGYNHLCDLLPPTSEFVFWYKHQPVETYAGGNLHTQVSQRREKCSIIHILEHITQIQTVAFIPRKNPLPYTNGFLQNTPKRATRYLILMSDQRQA